MFDDLKIRNKLILLLAGPIVIVLLLAAMGAKSRLASASDSRAVEHQVSLSKASADIVDALQQEALSSTAYVASNRKAYAKDVKATRAATDQVLAQDLSSIEGASGPYAASATLAAAAAKKLNFVRDAVDQGYRWDQVVTTYGETQDTFLALNTTVTDSVTEAGAAGQLRTAATLAAYKSALAREAAIVTGAAERGGLGSVANAKLLADTMASEQIQSTLFKSVATADRKEATRNALSSDAELLFERVRDQAVSAGSKGALDAKGSAVATSGATVIADLHKVESSLFDDELSSARSARSTAARAADLFLAAALVAIVAATAAAVLLGRRITRPLGHLTEAADRLSQQQMPRLIETLKNPAEEEMGFQIGSLKPIEIDSNDEIGQLAKAFNEVQRVAGQVASEQAQLLRKGIGEMFVNLARRNQALLDRQIEFIDELERGEEDPDQLQNLYRLDHLATRMRRNAESLLVLAGAEPPRRRGRPAPLANVVRAALAEVEDFGRIELLSFDEVLVASNAAADLAHLLSELMENATNFSPPETKVEVVGHKTKADGYVISITDHGIGMAGDQIVEANESLARPPLVGLAMTRSLGFIVVGRLAGRHGIAVRMMPSAAGGVTAVVSIPPSLVVDTPGGMMETASQIEAPARLKPVLESPTSGLAPLEFLARDDGPPNGSPAPGPAPTPAPAPEPFSAPAPAASAPGRDVPGPAVFAPPPDAAPTPAPAPSASPAQAMPTRRPPAPAPEPAAPAAAAAQADAPALPEALTFAAPDDDRSPLETTVTPDYPPGPEDLIEPAAPRSPVPPSVAGTHLDGAAPKAPQSNRPFFLEDAEPPRPFGQSRSDAAPAPAPAPAPAAPPRLFGGPSPSPSGPTTGSGLASRTPQPAAPAASSAGPHLDTRPPAAPGPHLDTKAPPAPRSAAPAAAPAAAPSPEAGGTTTSGLAKRVPRAKGATRAIPGSETERGVGATRRSPEEIRKMLSSHSQGRQRARTTEPVPSGPSDQKESQ